MEKRIYSPLPAYSGGEIARILNEGTAEEQRLLSLSVGEYEPDWKKAQDICLRLMDSQNPHVRANAALGLSYIARTKGRLEKHMVKPYLLRELRENQECRWRIVDAIQDINLFLGWNLAAKALKTETTEES